MQESLSLWETIVNYAIFGKASMILFLNKVWNGYLRRQS